MDGNVKSAGSFLSASDGGPVKWDQTLTEVTVCVDVNKSIKRDSIRIEISPRKLRVCVSDLVLLEGSLFGIVDTSESTWTFTDHCITVMLEKGLRAQVWKCLFVGDQDLNCMQLDDVKRKLLLERFGAENPGFDFSGAVFSGSSVPDPRTFMDDLR